MTKNSSLLKNSEVFKREASNLARSLELSSNTQWLAEFRAQGLAAFEKTPFPTRKTEHFKYNNLTTLTKEAFTSLAQPSNTDDDLPDVLMHPNAERLVLIDGLYIQAHSSVSPDRLTLFSNANDSEKAFILKCLNKKIDQKNIFDLLNRSLLQEGYLLNFEEAADPKPLHIIYLTSKNSHRTTQLANLIIRVNKNATAKVIEHFISELEPEQTSLVNQSTQCILEENASLDHYRLHMEQENNLHVGTLNFWLNRDAQLKSFHLGLGGRLKRLDLNLYHQAPGAHADLKGIYFSNHKQQIDYHTQVEHQAPHCTTEEVFRGIVGGQSKAVFNGRIHIHPGAQKSLAELSNKNLLLSNKAEIYTKPELEIYADDVQCAHGATVAQLDEAALFYLQSRGIPKTQAHFILSVGFINELIDGIDDESISEYLRPILADCLEQAAAQD